MAVQSRVFSRTADPRELVAEQAAIQVEVNSFLSTLVPVNVLDVRRSIQSVGKYGASCFLWVEVLYLEE